MKLSLLVFLFFNSYLFGQTQNVSGIVLADDLNGLAGVIIKNLNNEVVGKTDLNGMFQLILPENINELKFGFIGWETLDIKFSRDCNFLEIIMLPGFTYDYVSLKKANRLREKRIKKFPQIYQEAFYKSLIKTKFPCFEQKFIE